MSKVPPRPQQSKRERAAAKSVPVRAHQRNLNEKPKPTRHLSLAERFRGQR